MKLAHITPDSCRRAPVSDASRAGGFRGRPQIQRERLSPLSAAVLEFPACSIRSALQLSKASPSKERIFVIHGATCFDPAADGKLFLNYVGEGSGGDHHTGSTCYASSRSVDTGSVLTRWTMQTSRLRRTSISRAARSISPCRISSPASSILSPVSASHGAMHRAAD